MSNNLRTRLDSELGVNFLTGLQVSFVAFLFISSLMDIDWGNEFLPIGGSKCIRNGRRKTVGGPPRRIGVRRVPTSLGAPGGVCGEIGRGILNSWRTLRVNIPYLSRLAMNRFVITMCVGFLRGCMLI